MTIYEAIDNLKKLNSSISEDLPEYAKQVAANDLSALVSRRVISTGKNHLGKKFSNYSEKEVPAWKFWGKSRNQTAERKVRQKSRDKGALSYKEFRSLNNLEVTKKIFEFTGRMWAQFGIVSFSKSGSIFKISLGGTTSEAQYKMDNSSEKEGINILLASKEEEKKIINLIEKWLIRKANTILR